MGLRRWKGQRDYCFKESWSDGGDSAAPPLAGPPQSDGGGTVYS